jgi:hypothetical protein
MSNNPKIIVSTLGKNLGNHSNVVFTTKHKIHYREKNEMFLEVSKVIFVDLLYCNYNWSTQKDCFIAKWF